MNSLDWSDFRRVCERNNWNRKMIPQRPNRYVKSLAWYGFRSECERHKWNRKMHSQNPYRHPKYDCKDLANVVLCVAKCDSSDRDLEHRTSS